MPEPPIERRSRRRLILWLLLAAALARVLYLQQVAALPFFDDPVGDSARHLERAAEIRAGRWLPDRPFFYGGIPYPWILAGAGVVFGRNLYPVCLAQALGGVALVWLIFRLGTLAARSGARRSGRRAGLAAAVLAAFYGPFAFLEADLLMVSWTLVLLTAAGCLLLRARRRSGGAHRGVAVPRPGGGAAWLTAAAGLLLALASMERPNLVALLPAGAAWCLFALPRRAGARAAVSLMAAGTIALVPVAAANLAASGRFVLLTTSSGINFSIGNHAGARGTFAEPWDEGDDPHATARDTDLERSSLDRARRLSGRPLDPVEASGFWWEAGWRWIRSHPGEAARLWGRKLALLWNGQELPNHLHFSFLREVAPALWLLPVGFAWVAPAGVWGLARSAARRTALEPAAGALLALMVAVPMLTVLPFFVADRYRAAMVPPLMAAAGFALAEAAEALAAPARRRAALAWILVLVAAPSLLSIPMVESDRSRDHWMLAQAWKKRGDLDQAVRSYDRAIDLSPDDAVLRNNKGVALAGMGRLAEAEEEYRRAIALGPGLVFPRKNLGLLLARAGRPQEALALLQWAHAREPGDPETAAAIAALERSP
jgi:tetratricopeptide (TPR) repeat protein